MCQRQRQRHRMRFFPMPRVGRSLTKDHRVERTDVDAAASKCETTSEDDGCDAEER